MPGSVASQRSMLLLDEESDKESVMSGFPEGEQGRSNSFLSGRQFSFLQQKPHGPFSMAAAEAALQNLWSILGGDRLCCADREKAAARPDPARMPQPLRPSTQSPSSGGSSFCGTPSRRNSMPAEGASSAAPSGGANQGQNPASLAVSPAAADPGMVGAGADDDEGISSYATAIAVAAATRAAAKAAEEEAALAEASTAAEAVADSEGPEASGVPAVGQQLRDAAAPAVQLDLQSAQLPPGGYPAFLEGGLPSSRSTDVEESARSDMPVSTLPVPARLTEDEIAMRQVTAPPPVRAESTDAQYYMDSVHNEGLEEENAWEAKIEGSVASPVHETCSLSEYDSDGSMAVEEERPLQSFYEKHHSNTSLEQEDDQMSNASSDGSLQDRLEKCRHNLLTALHREKEILGETEGQKHARDVAENLYASLKALHQHGKGDWSSTATAWTPARSSAAPTPMADKTPASLKTQRTAFTWLSDSTPLRLMRQAGSMARHQMSRIGEDMLQRRDPREAGSSEEGAIVDRAYEEFGLRDINRVRQQLEAQGRLLPEPPQETQQERERRLRREKRGSHKLSDTQQKVEAYKQLMTSEVSAYQDMMRDRLRSIGVPDADTQSFKETLSPAEAVKDAVLKYHTHCEDLGKFYAFSPTDAPPRGGIPLEQRAMLASYMRDLAEQDPDRFAAPELPPPAPRVVAARVTPLQVSREAQDAAESGSSVSGIS